MGSETGMEGPLRMARSAPHISKLQKELQEEEVEGAGGAEGMGGMTCAVIVWMMDTWKKSRTKIPVEGRGMIE